MLAARRVGELERVRRNLLNTKLPNGIQSIRPEIVPLDLADINQIAEKAHRILRSSLHVDILINNGGVSLRSDILSVKQEVDQQLMNVNYFGTIALTKGKHISGFDYRNLIDRKPIDWKSTLQPIEWNASRLILLWVESMVTFEANRWIAGYDKTANQWSDKFPKNDSLKIFFFVNVDKFWIFLRFTWVSASFINALVHFSVVAVNDRTEERFDRVHKQRRGATANSLSLGVHRIKACFASICRLPAGWGGRKQYSRIGI